MKLMKRLETVLRMMPICYKIADIGTDHGYLAVALMQGGKAKRVVASDVNSKPLESAKKYILENGMQDVIECRLGSGFTVLEKEEVDAASLCGMGGFLIRELLEEASWVPDVLILQPQNGRRELKEYLFTHGYKIVGEDLVFEAGHYYDVWHVEKTREHSLYDGLSKEDISWEWGAYLLHERHPLARNYMEHQRRVMQKKVQGMKRAKTQQVEVSIYENTIKEIERWLHETTSDN